MRKNKNRSKQKQKALNNTVFFADQNFFPKDVLKSNKLTLDQFAATFKPGVSNFTKLLALLVVSGTIVGCEPIPTTIPTLATEPPAAVENMTTPTLSPITMKTPFQTTTPTLAATLTPDFSGYVLIISSNFGEYTCTVDAKIVGEVNYLLANCPQTPKGIEGRQVDVKMLKNSTPQGSFTKVDNLLDLLGLIGIDASQIGNFIPSTQEGSFICVPNQPGPFLCGADYEGNLLLVEGDAVQFVPTPTSTVTPDYVKNSEVSSGGPGSGGVTGSSAGAN